MGSQRGTVKSALLQGEESLPVGTYWRSRKKL